MRTARRIDALPPYLFAEIDRKVAQARARGADIISFGVGDPDHPTPRHVVEALREAATDPSTHRYPAYAGMPEFRAAIARWYERRFGVSLDPDAQVQPLLGSKEGIFHLPVAFVDPGDIALVPDPGYPVYETGAVLAGGRPVPLPLVPERGFHPDLEAVASDVLADARVLWLNYPSNPTAATTSLAFFEEAVDLCRRHDMLLAHDAAYTEVTYDGYVAPSVLQARGAMECAVEFHSLSNAYSMPG